MTRVLSVVALLALVIRTPGADAPEAPKPNTVALTVSPAAAPVPALKYEFLPKLRDRTPGNAALDYHRAYMLRPNWPKDPAESRKQDEMVLKWEELPVEKMPVEDVRNFLLNYAGTFKCLDQAARCDRCDWELTRKIQGDSIGLLLPEVQANRELVRFQKLRIRLDLAENKFDAAARNLQTGYRLAKDVGEGPTLIQMLVGIALAAIFTDAADDFIRRPGSPNLYWAITSLPQPFIDPRPSLEGESLFFESIFPNIREFEKGPVSAERANLMIEEMLGGFRRSADGGPAGDDPLAVIGKLGVTTYVALHYQEAKKQLIAAGRPAAEVEKMPATQVVVLRSVGVYRALSDDQAKCFHLPYPKAKAELAKIKERAAKLSKENETDLLVRLFTLMLPATEKVYEAHARTGRRFAGLRAVEAVRMHAAANNGQPPKALADITLVPVPDDPNTGKPFEYSATGNTFVVTAPPPAGDPPHAANNFRYEVTIRGK